MTGKQILAQKEIHEHTDRLVGQMLDADKAMDNVVLVGIITRGVILAERIARQIAKRNNIEVAVGSLDTRPYRDDAGADAIEDRSKMPFSIDGRDVILVDDVLCTGRTVRAAMDALMHHGRPKSIRTAVLIDRGHRELPITADFTGVRIPTASRERIRVSFAEIDGGKDTATIVSQ